MKILNCDQLVELSQNPPKHPMILNGLKSAHVGMLIAAPGMGKSRLAFSIAIEAASCYQLIGLKSGSTPIPTLIFSTEDGEDEVAKRMSQYFSYLPKQAKNEVNQNLNFVCDSTPIVVPAESERSIMMENVQHLEKLNELFSNYKLVIIDTVSEAIGECDEVKHDRLIKNTIRRLAVRSGAAILLIHHVNKTDIRGTHDLTMASGAGLTTVMRLSKYLLGLKKHNNQIQLHYLKHNYIPEPEARVISLVSNEIGLFSSTETGSKDSNASSLPNMPHDAEQEVTTQPTKKKTRNRRRVSDEPREIQIKAEPEEEDIGSVRGVL